MNKRQCVYCSADAVSCCGYPRLAATWCLQINHIAVRGGRGSPGGVLRWFNDARLRYTKRPVPRVKSDCSLLCCHESTRTESTLQWQSIVDWVVTFDCLQIHQGPTYNTVWYGMVNVDLYSAIITKVSNAHVLQQPRDNLSTIMTKLRSTYDGRLIYITSYASQEKVTCAIQLLKISRWTTTLSCDNQ